MKLSKSSAASAYQPGCPSHRMVKGWRSNRGYMFAMMLAMLALMAVMGVGLSRLMMTTKATTQMQRTQDTKQLLNSVVMTLSSKAADGDGDFVLEPPAYSTETITGFTAPTNGGAVGTDVANTDAWGRRLGYCAYDYGSQPTVAATGRIRGSTDSSPTDSWVALVVISAGPDGVINTTSCPAAGTAASDVAATGDDMVAARSYGEMISFGNAQIASSLSGMGSKSTNKLCRLGSDGKMVCDIKTGLSGSNTANRFCRTDADGALVCDTEATTCSAGQVSKWNGVSFDCINVSNGRVPVGGIIMWSGTVASIPPGYALCDGTSGTPDLRNRFVVGATSDASTGVTFNADSGAVSGTYKPGNFGGEVAHQLTVDQMPSHTHRMCQADEGVRSGGAAVMDGFRSGNCFAPESVGGNDFHENRPPYYALAFIMRVF